MMTIENLTLEVLAERALTPFDSKRLVDWAVSVLELGHENESLIILAGLDHDSTEEREKYFFRSVTDLGLNINTTEEELIDKYALTIASRAIRKEISIRYAFSEMLKIASASGYNNRYVQFYYIDEDLDRLGSSDGAVFTTGLTLQNIDEFIADEFRLFIEMERLKIPAADKDKCYCPACKKLVSPILRTRFQFTKPFRYRTWCCETCGSKDLLFSGDHKVKQLIIDNAQKQHNLSSEIIN